MNLQTLLQKLEESPDSIEFKDAMDVIEAIYDFTPTAFKNGELMNEAGQNNGSCKLFSFAKLQGLSTQQTLQCFGAYYRDDVLLHPHGTDHQNIRNFIKAGWTGVEFKSAALKPKPTPQ